MPRPRVPEEKRQRTARACESCKRRKQKCNGLKPCNTCLKRSLTCDYTDRRGLSGSVSISSPVVTKRRLIAEAPSKTEHVSNKLPCNATKQANRSGRSGERRRGTQERRMRIVPETSLMSEGEGKGLSRHRPSSETDEEAEVIGQIRMLQDPMERLLYVGDSSTLSYLQLIRMIVDNATGSSPFTQDPNRHDILEPVTSAPSTSIVPYILPEREVSNLLVRSYFTNTHGLVELFDRTTFHQYLDACYSNPLSVKSSTLCLVYLILAIGLVMATPPPNSAEEAIVNRLRDDPADRAEALFRAAKCLSDPLNNIENADLWVIQAWALMAVYMLATSKGNAAYAYCGMAVRSAFALGMHRIRETMVRFDDEKLRRNIWRSLFVLDRFLAASLGRPGAIHEEDCSEDSLDIPAVLMTGPDDTTEDVFRSRSLDFSVKTSRSIGLLLKKVYLRRKISTSLAQDIADECELWSINVHPSLASDNLFKSQVTADRGMAILHAHLLHHHSIILFTRPFFLHLLVKTRPVKSSDGEPSHRTSSRLERFSQACVDASTQTVTFIQAAFEANHLPRRNPFVLYFLFAAALIILSNEFAGLYENSHYASSMSNAMKMMEYCAMADTQARRMLYILRAFRADVDKHSQQSTNTSQRQDPSLPEGSIADPVQILDSGRQSVVGRQRSVVDGGGPQSGLHGEMMMSQAAPPVQFYGNTSPTTVRMDDMAISPANSRGTSTYHSGTDPESVVTEHDFDLGRFWDLRPTADSDDGDEYVYGLESTRLAGPPVSGGKQSAFQLHGGDYGAYSGHNDASNAYMALDWC